MTKKKVTMTTTFIMDDSPESIENFKIFEENIASGDLNEALEGEGWTDVKIDIVSENVD